MHFNVRLEDERLAALVVIGARPDGTKEVVALEDGYRESTESWLANPIESTFATVKLRQRVTKGAGSRGAGLAMAHRLLLLAERTWRRLDGHELLPLVRAGVKFKDGAQVERNDGAANKGKRGKIAA